MHSFLTSSFEGPNLTPAEKEKAEEDWEAEMTALIAERFETFVAKRVEEIGLDAAISDPLIAFRIEQDFMMFRGLLHDNLQAFWEIDCNLPETIGIEGRIREKWKLVPREPN